MDHYWIYDEEKNKYYCSICNFESDEDFDICPSCGCRHHMTFTKAEHDSILQEEEKLTESDAYVRDHLLIEFMVERKYHPFTDIEDMYNDWKEWLKEREEQNA